jgi:hypothetical protein
MIRTVPTRVGAAALSPQSSSTSSNGTSSPLDRRMAELDTVLHRLRRNVVMADGEREKRIRTCEFEQRRLDSVRFMYQSVPFGAALDTACEWEC